MRVHDRRTRDDIGWVHLEHGDRTRLIPTLRGVDQHEQVTPVEQFINQVNATDAEVGDLDAVRSRPLREQLDHLHTEGVIPQENVADPGHQRPARAPGHWHGSTSSGAK